LVRTAADRLERLVTRWQTRRQATAEFDARDPGAAVRQHRLRRHHPLAYTDEERSLSDDMTAMGEMFSRMVGAR
jgi:hypothetical protein